MALNVIGPAGLSTTSTSLLSCRTTSGATINQYPATATPDALSLLATEVTACAPDVLVAVGRKDAAQVSAGVEALGLPRRTFLRKPPPRRT